MSEEKSRERERESQADSLLRVGPDAGLELTAPRSDLSRNQEPGALRDCAIDGPSPCLLQGAGYYQMRESTNVLFPATLTVFYSLNNINKNNSGTFFQKSLLF